MSDRLELNKNLAQMLKGGVIMDVTNAKEAEIAQAAGAAVSYTHLPYIVESSPIFGFIRIFHFKKGDCREKITRLLPSCLSCVTCCLLYTSSPPPPLSDILVGGIHSLPYPCQQVPANIPHDVNAE